MESAKSASEFRSIASSALRQTLSSAIFLDASSLLFPEPEPSAAGFCALPFALTDVESFGSSLVYSMNSGAPSMYFRRTSGTFIPYERPMLDWRLAGQGPNLLLRSGSSLQCSKEPDPWHIECS